MIVLILLLSLYVSVLVHELGHGVMGVIAGWRVTALGTGLGRVLGSFGLGRTRVFLGLRSPFSGVTFAFAPDLLPTRWQYLLYFSGGVLFNGLMAGAALGLDAFLGGDVRALQALAFVNGMQAIGNAIPFQANLGGVSMASDGARIAQVLGRGMVDESPVATAEAYAFLSPMWEDIGDWESRYLYAVAAAQSWLALGDSARGRALLTEALALGAAPTPAVEAGTHLAESAFAAEEGDLPEAWRQLEVAKGLIGPESRAYGGVLFSEGELCLAQGDLEGVERAVQAFEALDNQGEGLHPTLKTGFLVLSLKLKVAQGDDDAVETLREIYEARVKGLPPGHQTLPVYQTLMRHYGRRERWEDLADAAQQGAYVLAYFHRSLKEPEDKARFMRHSAPLRAQLEAAIQWADPSEAGGDLGDLFADPIDKEKAPSRSWMTLGLGLTLLAFLSSYASFVTGIEGPLSLMTLSMANLYAAPAALVQLLLVALGRGSGRWARVLGALSFIIGSLVWVAALVTAIFHLGGGAEL